jgi:hypothetical protein
LGKARRQLAGGRMHMGGDRDERTRVAVFRVRHIDRGLQGFFGVDLDF